MGKDKEKDPIDEALDESFPASDPPSWTASPPPVTPSAERARQQVARLQEAARRGGDAFARRLAGIPQRYLVWTGLGLAATSLSLLAAGKARASLLVGMWVPPVLLAAGLRDKVARSGRPADRAHLH